MTILEFDNKNYPDILRKIKNPPKRLYIKGNLENLNKFGISVIGTRNPTEYGKRMTEKFCKQLLEYGICIISGMAKGVDTYAHIQAIENNGITIAVLPSGFNYIYPEENKKLYNEIINCGGTIVSEYEPNIKAKYSSFLERNRIVSGLSRGTLVIEAGQRSGTSVTARISNEQNKEVFCIPSSLENKKGIGTNNLIKKGANLVTNVKDILSKYENFEFIKKDISKPIKINKNEYNDIYEILSDNPIHIEDIYKKCRLNINEINYKLMMMELEDYIIQLPGKQFIIK